MEGRIRRTVLYVNEILATKCGCGVDDRRRDVFIFQRAVVEGSLALIFQ